jgi:hypothetical protein
MVLKDCQIRDNEFNTIAERQKANDDLLKVLEKQEAANALSNKINSHRQIEQQLQTL